MWAVIIVLVLFAWGILYQLWVFYKPKRMYRAYIRLVIEIETGYRREERAGWDDKIDAFYRKYEGTVGCNNYTNLLDKLLK